MNNTGFHILLTILLTGFAHSTAAQEGKPGVYFEEEVHDYGDIKEEDGLATHEFTFINPGTGPLQILSVHASCGCTKPVWPVKAIPPGGKGGISVAYNPLHRPGVFMKTISVRTNASDKPVVLRIRGNVIPRPVKIEDIYPLEAGPVRLNKTELNFGTFPETSVRLQDLLMINTEKARYEYRFDAPAHINVMTNPFIDAEGNAKALVEYDAGARNSYGPATDTIYLLISENKYPIYIEADVRQDFNRLTPKEKKEAPVAIFTKEKFDASGSPADSLVSDSLIVKNTGGRLLSIHRIWADDERFSAQCQKQNLAPSGQMSVHLFYDISGMEPGTYTVGVNMIMNVPKRPRKVMLFNIKVEEPSNGETQEKIPAQEGTGKE